MAVESAKILAMVIRNNYALARLELRNNNLGDEGAKQLAKGLRANASLVHLDLGCNNIHQEGIKAISDSLISHPTLNSLDLSNVEGCNRNRVGPKGAYFLSVMLIKNKILSMLNLADTTLGNDGVNYIA